MSAVKAKPQLKTARTNNSEYLASVDEKAVKGPWSDIETLLLYFLMSNGTQDSTILHGQFNDEALKLQKKFFSN